MAERYALVTGAGTGIGRAAALALVKDGWTVALVGRRVEPLEETRSLAADPARAMPMPADVTDRDAVARVFDAVRQRFGRLDLLFNNAGQGSPARDFGDTTWEDWSRVVDINLHAAFLCAHAAYRIMRDQAPKGGRIINNGSISAHTPRPGAAPYNATKHAITGLTKTIALDGRAHDIACGQIDIGNAVTPLTERMAGGVMQADGSMKPEPRMDVAHVGDAIAQMARLPLESNVLFMTIMATKMPFVGRG